MPRKRNTTTQGGNFTEGTVETEAGGSQDLGYLRPYEWEKNRYNSDDFPNWICKTKA